ncbi:MAG: DinB family protein [Hyphomicrobiaceae bacterium]
MITFDHVRLMAAYNSWQNRSIFAAASTLSDKDRKAERGAFFGSIHGTLNHILWGDQMWMRRFTDTPPSGPKSIRESTTYFAEWEPLQDERFAFDQRIADWTATLDPRRLGANLTWYSGAVGSEKTLPTWLLVTHFFNHQTHHRGQVHCMLTQAGALPDDTDLPLLPMLTAEDMHRDGEL